MLSAMDMVVAILSAALERRRAEVLKNIGRLEGTVEGFMALAADEAYVRLQQIPGIGPWTAGYMLMRGWSWPDVFPPGDVVLRKALSGDGPPLSPQAYRDTAERYRPFRSYAVLHLWRHA